MTNAKVANWDDLEPLAPAYALVANVDLVVIRWPGEEVASVLYGRCLHRGALLADGRIAGDVVERNGKPPVALAPALPVRPDVGRHGRPPRQRPRGERP